MNKELELALDILRPVTYVITEEEDRVIREIYEKVKEDAEKDPDDITKFQVNVYSSTLGLRSYNEYVSTRSSGGTSNDQSRNFVNTLNRIYDSKAEEQRDVYILLDIDHYLSGMNDASHQVIRRIKDIILQLFYDQASLKSIIIVSPDLVIPRKLQRYIEAIYADLPTEADIKEKSDKVLEDFNSTIQEDDKKIQHEISPTIVRSLKGLTHFEIEQITLASMKQFKCIDPKAIEDYKRSILRKTDLLDLMDTNITFEDVGGMNRLKHWLDVRSQVWTEEGIKLGVPLLKGALLLGITGCGKSLVARAIANQYGLPLVEFNPSRVFSSRVGESESNIRKALKIVESISPCVMFIDEIEKQFAGSQSSTFSDAGTTSRVISTFLTWYQDCTQPIFVVATCNSVEYLPPELISRFDDKFFVNIPNRHERKKIFEIQLEKHWKKWRESKLDLDKLAEGSTQFTGREIEQIVKSSIHEMAYERKLKGNKVKYEQKHLNMVLNSKVPIIKTMDNEIKYLIQWVGWDDDKKEGLRANWANERELTQDIDLMLEGIMKSESVLGKGRKKKE